MFQLAGVVAESLLQVAGDPSRVEAMRKIHAKCAGEKRTFAHFRECLKRRPDDRDVPAAKFSEHKGYDVATPIARDGVHPSNPKAFGGDGSDEGLRSNGFALRNHVILTSYGAVIRGVLQEK